MKMALKVQAKVHRQGITVYRVLVDVYMCHGVPPLALGISTPQNFKTEHQFSAGSENPISIYIPLVWV
jgi:hypothetical protein